MCLLQRYVLEIHLRCNRRVVPLWPRTLRTTTSDQRPLMRPLPRKLQLLVHVRFQPGAGEF